MTEASWPSCTHFQGHLLSDAEKEGLEEPTQPTQAELVQTLFQEAGDWGTIRYGPVFRRRPQCDAHGRYTALDGKEYDKTEICRRFEVIGSLSWKNRSWSRHGHTPLRGSRFDVHRNNGIDRITDVGYCMGTREEMSYTVGTSKRRLEPDIEGMAVRLSERRHNSYSEPARKFEAGHRVTDCCTFTHSTADTKQTDCTQAIQKSHSC